MTLLAGRDSMLWRESLPCSPGPPSPASSSCARSPSLTLSAHGQQQRRQTPSLLQTQQPQQQLLPSSQHTPSSFPQTTCEGVSHTSEGLHFDATASEDKDKDKDKDKEKEERAERKLAEEEGEDCSPCGLLDLRTLEGKLQLLQRQRQLCALRCELFLRDLEASPSVSPSASSPRSQTARGSCKLQELPSLREDEESSSVEGRGSLKHNKGKEASGGRRQWETWSHTPCDAAAAPSHGIDGEGPPLEPMSRGCSPRLNPSHGSGRFGASPHGSFGSHRRRSLEFHSRHVGCDAASVARGLEDDELCVVSSPVRGAEEKPGGSGRRRSGSSYADYVQRHAAEVGSARTPDTPASFVGRGEGQRDHHHRESSGLVGHKSGGGPDGCEAAGRVRRARRRAGGGSYAAYLQRHRTAAPEGDCDPLTGRRASVFVRQGSNLGDRRDMVEAWLDEAGDHDMGHSMNRYTTM